ncbi:hypothetical protein EON79_23330 [bacterium]|nr:MAG: hypothetical protein EON79_23330 [bacterium]
MNHDKITDGANDRAKEAPIGQTARGLPDDSGKPIEVDETEVVRVREKLMGEDGLAETEAHPS